MDKKRGLLNVIVSIAFKVLLLVGAILVRRYLIKYIGDEVNGLNSLYSSIIGFLAVAELGVGSAITFCMYKPIVEGDNDKVSALYHLFTKLYLIIGAIILVAGCALIPLLPYLVADYEKIDQNVYFTFFLMLVSVVVTYLFSSKTSLINAYKNNYIATIISSSAHLLQYALQITVLVLTHSFVWFLVCAIGAALLQWGVTELAARKKYNAIIKNRQKIDSETKKEVTKNVKAMFMHKIGSVLVNTADSVIISAFIGSVILGKYSNYTTIMTAMTGVLVLFFTPLTSVIGHMCVENDTGSVKKYLNFFHTFNFIIGIIFFLGYYAVIDSLVNICFRSEEPLELAKSVSFIITLNYFIQFMRQSALLFRDATGTFYNDRWKPLFEGLLNVGLSIGFIYLFSYCFGADFAVVGVIVATIITNLTICHIVEPHVLHKYGLKSKTTNYYIRNYVYIAIFAALLVALHFCLQALPSYGSEWIELLIHGSVAVAFAVAPCLAVMLLNKDFRHYFKQFSSKLKRKKATQTNTIATPVLDVYTAEIPEECEINAVFPPSRQEEIESCSNLSVKRQKYAVWKLLEYGLKTTFGYDINNLEFVQGANGKWSCSACEFSLSHSNNVVAVALSKEAVGIDVERVSAVKPELSEKILTGNELSAYSSLTVGQEEYLSRKWTEKESVFKKSGEAVFRPSETDTEGLSLRTERLTVADEEYFLTVAADDITNFRFIPNVKL